MSMRANDNTARPLFRDTIFLYLGIYRSARKHGIADEDIEHAIQHALAEGEQDDGKVLYLGADRAGNLLEIVSVVRDNGTENRDPCHADAPQLRAVPPREGRGR